MNAIRAGDNGLAARLIALYAGLLALNGAAWTWALAAFHHDPVLLGIAVLAYSLGLRHAVDADHIAAIDNVTRKLMQAGERPVSVGLFFSLGHCTVVVLVSIVVALTAGASTARMHQFQALGSVAGTLASASFLFAIALANTLILVSMYRSLVRARHGSAYLDVSSNPPLCGGGLLMRMFRPLLRLVARSWHMYPLGFVFGLGFDTATEIAVLGISATQATRGLQIGSILLFPLLFTAGMTLIDTLDSSLMVGVYGWALVKPIRKLYYNLSITFISVAIAVLVASVELLGLWADKAKLDGRPWHALSALNGNFATLGYIIIAVFMFSWLISTTVCRLRRHGKRELNA